MERMVIALFLLMLIISIVGYLNLEVVWLEYTFAHLGGLSILGLIGSFIGIIALKKGYNFWKTLLVTILLPVILGFTAVLIVQPMTCGGTVSLASSFLLLIIFSVLRHSSRTKLI
jgi:hypothetical protein